MPDKIMNIYIRQTIEAQKTNTVTIAWQGGEPTLMGIDFFRRSIKVIERYSRPGMQIEKTLQTNGTLLNDEWCRFLRENNFLVEMLNGSPFHYTAGNAGSFLPVMVNVLRTEF